MRCRRFRDSRSSCQQPKIVRRAKVVDGQAPSAAEKGEQGKGEHGKGGKAKGGDGTADE